MSEATSASNPTGEQHRRPRWLVTLVAVIVIAVLLAVALMLVLGGEHGPGRHGAQEERQSPQAGQRS